MAEKKIKNRKFDKTYTTYIYICKYSRNCKDKPDSTKIINNIYIYIYIYIHIIVLTNLWTDQFFFFYSEILCIIYTYIIK